MHRSWILLFAFGCVAPSAIAQSTAFTFQGRLKSGSAAEGLYDLRLQLFDADLDGTQLGETA